MKNNFYLYGFVFALLVALLVYFNSSKGLDRQSREIDKLEQQIIQLETELQKCKEKENKE
jgi:cell division protein FtsL